jgi:UDP-N-acetylmuramoyl-L-alanyl-D-glutamate--2,6-diaminopimelate ligase
LKSLGEFLPNDTGIKITGSVDKQITAFQFDSRKVGKGIAFVAKKGTQLDGHDFISQAIDAGCELIICEYLPEFIPPQITFVQCSSVTELLEKMLPVFYDLDLNDLKIIAVTGTNGKTTVATLLYQLFSQLGFRCGLISTIENLVAGELLVATHTTPDQISLFELLSRMQKKHCSHVFMEVSSHALDQDRIKGLPFTAALFTNISHDHLDYHKTFRAYIQAKKKLFDGLNKSAIAIVNVDDRNGKIMIQNTRARVITYALNSMADHRAKVLENSLNGLHLKFDDTDWHSGLIGEFNAYNLLAIYSCAIEMGVEKSELMECLSLLHPPEGRFDQILSKKDNKIGIVDYAHTPDALEKIINNIRGIRKKSQRIITVIGCGGNRDAFKRPLMAGIATELSDRVILTSDNPRDEDPMDILQQMEAGISEDKKENYLVIEDRAQAIKTACMMAAPSDIILVAGKGHEKYQEIKGQKLLFDDKEILKQFLLN